MPDLDMSDVLVDPMFNDKFDVERRTLTVGNDGIGALSIQTFDDVIGVVTAGKSDLVRDPDQQHMPRTISIVTQFRLRGPAPNTQADVVVWAGNRYVVNLLDNYTRYGPGWVQAECSSMDSIDEAPEE